MTATNPSAARAVPEQIEKLGHFHRYADEDEYFVTPRTLPGVLGQRGRF